MSYLQGFLIAVPEGKREAYRAMAEKAAPIFAEHGAARVVETWGDDVADGTRTDMKRAVKAHGDENVVFSWIEWPDKATCDAAAAKLMADERMQPDGEMPFDGKRMVFAGFDTIHDSGSAGPFGYVDGMVARVPSGDAAAVRAFEESATPIFLEKGARRLAGGVASDIKPGTTTDFLRAVDAGEGEMITFGWIEWPDKATRDAGMGALMQDERMAAIAPAWDGPTAIFGGFVPLLDTAHA